MRKKQIQVLLLASCLFLSACNTNKNTSSYTPPIDTSETTTTEEENIEEHKKRKHRNSL